MTKDKESSAIEVLGEEEPRTGATRNEVSFSPSEAGGEVPEFGPTASFRDAFPGVNPVIIDDPGDGLPRPADGPPGSIAPPLSHDTLVCLEDRRLWVEIFAEEGGHNNRRLQARSSFDSDGKDVERRTFSSDRVTTFFGYDVVNEDNGVWTPVRPIRPRCIHLTEQISFGDDMDGPDGKPVQPMQRFCKAFRSVGGAFMSLTDEGVVACGERFPQSPKSEALLAARTQKKIEQGKRRVMLPQFNLTKGPDYSELAAEARSMVTKRPRLLEGLSWQWRMPDDLLRVPQEVADARIVIRVAPDPAAYAGDPEVYAAAGRVVFCDSAWQPDEEWVCSDGWGKSGSGEVIYRLILDDPSWEREEDDVFWPKVVNPLLDHAIKKNAVACAEVLRSGRRIEISATSLDGQGALFAAMVQLALLGMFTRPRPLIDAPLEGQLYTVPPIANRIHRNYLLRQTQGSLR